MKLFWQLYRSEMLPTLGLCEYVSKHNVIIRAYTQRKTDLTHCNYSTLARSVTGNPKKYGGWTGLPTFATLEQVLRATETYVMIQGSLHDVSPLYETPVHPPKLSVGISAEAMQRHIDRHWRPFLQPQLTIHR